MRRHIFRVGTAILTVGLTVATTATPALAAPPANDDRADAELIAALPFEATGIDTTEATVEADEPEVCAPIGATIWYSFTATSSSWLEANTLDSTFDTVVAVWTDVGGELEAVACSDDHADFTSRAVWRAEEGTEYLIQVGGFVTSVGELTFRVLETSRPATVERLAITGGVERNGKLILHGVLRCVGADDRVFLRVSARQLWKRVYIRGSGSKLVTCLGRVEFRMKLRNRNGLFVPGYVRVRAFAFTDFNSTGFRGRVPVR